MTKKRSTGRWWLIVGGVLVVTCCGGGYVIYRTVPFVSDIPDTSRDLEKNAERAKAAGVPFVAADMAPKPPVTDAENAAPALQELFKKYNIELGIGDEQTKSVSEQVTQAVKNGDLATARALLKKYDDMLAMAEGAAKLPRCHFERDWDLGPNVLFPEEAKLKYLARLFTSRAEFKALDGDHRGAIEDITVASKLGDHAGSDPTVISLLVHIAIEAIANRAVETGLSLAEKPDDIQLYIDYLEKHRANYDLKRPLDGEAYMGVALFRNRNLFGSIGEVTGGDPPPSKPIDPTKLKRDGLPSKMLDRAFLSRHLELWAEVYETAKADPNNQHAMFDALRKVESRIESTNLPSYLMERILMPVFSQVNQASIRSEAIRNNNLALARVLLYRKTKGANPKSLADAGSKELDPFSGKPVLYLPAADKIRVYSVGPDKADDHGRLRTEVKASKNETWDEVAQYPSPQAQQLKSPVVPPKRIRAANHRIPKRP